MNETLFENRFTTSDGRDCLVRPARWNDAKECLRIHRAAAAMRPRTILTSPNEVWGPREWRKRMLALGDRGIALVAELDGHIVGNLGAHRGDRPPLRHIVELGITVDEPFRGLGIGRALMEGLEVWARHSGIERLALGVYDGNEPARALYASLGYETEGIERHGAKFPEGYVDIVRMAKLL